MNFRNEVRNHQKKTRRVRTNLETVREITKRNEEERVKYEQYQNNWENNITNLTDNDE